MSGIPNRRERAIAIFSDEQWQQVQEMKRDSEALRRWRDNPLQHYAELAERGIDPRRGVDYAAHWRRIGSNEAMGRPERERA